MQIVFYLKKKKKMKVVHDLVWLLPATSLDQPFSTSAGQTQKATNGCDP